MAAFRASAASVDLEPKPGCWLTGFGARIYPSDGQHDPIMARAVLLDDGATQIVIVACDLIGISAQEIATLRKRMAEHSRIPAMNIVISCTHTHSAPATLRFRGVLGYVNERWWATAQDKLVELVASLEAQLRPAQLSHASTQVEGISYNRQDQAHLIDTELMAVAIDDVDGRAIATLVNYAVHPVTLSFGNLKLSGDVPGATAQELEVRRGGVALYLQGACGDVNPSTDLMTGWGNGTFEDVADMSRQLAEAAQLCLFNAPVMDSLNLGVAYATVDLPLDAVPTAEQVDALFASFSKDLATARQARNLTNETTALSLLRWAGELKGAILNGTLPASTPIEVWTAAIGDLRLMAVPLEPYSDIALEFKKAVRPLSGMVLGYSNGLLGYCAADWAKDQGGYGPDEACRWFPEQLTAVGYGAAQRVVEAGVRLSRDD